MINLIIIITAIPVLVLLYSQWKINGQQEQFIKFESESLRQLQESNQKYIASDLFGLSSNCSYLKAPVTPQLLKHQREILTAKTFKSRSRREYQVY